MSRGRQQAVPVPGQQRTIPAVYMRGGTSKGVFFHKKDLPTSRVELDRLLLEIMGSPDSLQVDGLGGGKTSTSKAMIISVSEREGCDIDYLFAQVDVNSLRVSYEGNCGNLTAAVGAYAIDEGLVKAEEPKTVVRLHNLNTATIILSHVPVVDGRAAVLGAFHDAGVARPGAPIVSEYLRPAGTLGGSVFPTGNLKDEFNISAVGRVAVSVVDATSVWVFVDAEWFGLSGAELADDLNKNQVLIDSIESIRSEVAVLLGFATSTEIATARNPAMPRIAMVGPSRTYRDASGSEILGSEYDVSIRPFSMGMAHHAAPITAVASLAVACRVPGSVPWRACTTHGLTQLVRVGHSKGVTTASSKVEVSSEKVEVESVSISRTARRLMDGWAYSREGT